MASSFVRALVLGLIAVVTLTGFGCRRQNPLLSQSGTKLVVWGLWQESEMMQGAIEAFKTQTGLAVDYKKIATVAEYERLLLEALAEGKGPDVFVIHHTWVEQKRGIMEPAPAEIVDARDVQNEFVDVVGADLVRDGSVYALPTSVDTLALFYNRDLLNAGGIARPPQTWQDMLSAVERLTQVTRIGSITRSGAALGTAANINRAADIVQLLMIQSLPVTDASDIFSEETLVDERGAVRIATPTGEQALRFYTDFANREKKSYSWNLEQDYSLDAFAEGETAMLVNYAYQAPVIRAKNPRLNFAVAPMPQIADTHPVNFAAYWPFAVSHTSQRPELAWQFVRVLTGPQVAAGINQAQLVPPARRDDIPAVTGDPVLGAFAEQALTAVSWPRADITATDTIFHDMIDSVVTGRITIADALRGAEDKLNQIGRNRTSDEQP